jgi:hypothetical protein
MDGHWNTESTTQKGGLPAENPDVELVGEEPDQSALYYHKVHRLAMMLREMKNYPLLVEQGGEPIEIRRSGPSFNFDGGFDRIELKLPFTETAAMHIVGINFPKTLLVISREAILETRDDYPTGSFFELHVEIYFRVAADDDVHRIRCNARDLTFEMSLAVELEITYMLLLNEGVLVDQY